MAEGTCAQNGQGALSPEIPRLRLVIYDKKSTRSFEPVDFDEASALEKKYEGEAWLDIVAQHVDEILHKFSLSKEPNDHYIIDEEDRTVFQVPFLVRNSTETQYLYIICDSSNRITTIRQTAWERGPVESTLRFIGDIVDEETEDGKMPLHNFRDFVFTALLGACSDEFIATISASRKKVNKIYEGIVRHSDPMEAQAQIYQVHSFLSETFGTTIFLFREFVSLVRKGSGKHLKLSLYQSYLEKVMNDVTQAIEMRDGLENTLELISNTVRASLSDINIANTERLNRAVEILTRLSVLLMIPNSVFTFWPTLPISPHDTFLGLHSASWEMIIALLLTILGQVLISYYYKHSYIMDVLKKNR
ncbi:MAG: CorA family divalent cation transporter [Thermoplasmata archaeon]